MSLPDLHANGRAACTWCEAPAPYRSCLLHRPRPLMTAPSLTMRLRGSRRAGLRPRSLPRRSPWRSQAVPVRGRPPGPARRWALWLMAATLYSLTAIYRRTRTLTRVLTLAGGAS